MHRKSLSSILLGLLLLLTVGVRIGGLATDWRQGIYDWHPDAPRYFAQERNYIQRNYHPIAEGPLYTGNPYANILFLSWIWKGLHLITSFSGENRLSTDSFTLSKIGRFFYIFLSCLMVLILYFFSLKIFRRLEFALLSAFFFAISPLAIGLIHTIKPEVPLTFFLTLSACFAFLVSENDSFLFYLLAGLFAGIATGMKYNGVIVLVYLFAMHGFRVFKRRGEVSKSKLFLTTFFSPFLWIALLAWALFFYVTEPILWHNLKEGLEYIQGYLRVARYVGVPREVAIHPFSHFLFTLSKFPENFLLFLRCLPPPLFVPILLSPFVVPKKHRSILLRILLFPSVVVGVLFLTKSLFGEEYLLHPLPFLYIGASAGTIGLYERLTLSLPKPLKKVSELFFFSLIVFYGLFIGFREARYFRLGNIRSYAKEWADKNLPDKCIKTMLYTIPLRHEICRRQRAHVFVVPSEKTYKKHFHLPPGSILLKTFAFEKDKPLLHHLRGHHLRFYAKKGPMFSGTPIIPALPVPHFHLTKPWITRFVNGIDFDPGYNRFALIPEMTYRFLLVLNQRISSIPLTLINANIPNTLKINGKKVPWLLLPFEKKVIRIPVSLSFPWQAPYLYTFSIKAEHDLLLKVSFPALAALRHPTLEPLKIYALHKLTSGETISIPRTKRELSILFKKVFRYDYRYLSPLLKQTIPMDSMERITRPTDFFHPHRPNETCLFFREPVFLERGYYICDITADICLSPNAEARFKVIIPGMTLVQKVIHRVSREHPPFIKGCPGEYHFALPFHVPDGSLVHLLIETTEGCRVFLRHVSFRTDALTMIQVSMTNSLLHHFLQNPSKSLVPTLAILDPHPCDAETNYRVAMALAGLKQEREALRWLDEAARKSPWNRLYIARLAELYGKIGMKTKAESMTSRLSQLSGFLLGPWRFETGIKLLAARIPSRATAGQPFPVTLWVRLPNISGDLALSLIFVKGKKVFKALDFSILGLKRHGSSYEATIHPTLPQGKYKVFFTAKIPKINYAYRTIQNGVIQGKKRVFLKEIVIERTGKPRKIS